MSAFALRKILTDPTIGADGKNDVWSSAGGDDLPRLRGPCGNDPHGAVAPEHPRPGHGQATKRHRPRSSKHAVGCAQSKRLGPTQSSMYCQMHRYKISVNPEIGVFVQSKGKRKPYLTKMAGKKIPLRHCRFQWRGPEACKKIRRILMDKGFAMAMKRLADSLTSD